MFGRNFVEGDQSNDKSAEESDKDTENDGSDDEEEEDEGIYHDAWGPEDFWSAGGTMHTNSALRTL